MLRWLCRRQEARRLAQADAEALIRDHGAEAYREARQRERDVGPARRDDSRRPDGRHPHCTVALAQIPCWATTKLARAA